MKDMPAKSEMTAEGYHSTTVKRSSGKTLTRAEIEPSKNGGFVVKEFYRQADKKAGKGGMSMVPNGWMDPETATYASFESMVSGLKKCFAAT